MTVLLTILGISSLIVLHEMGHLALARTFGMRVSRFSVGFGPVLFSHKHGDTIWQIAAVPMGGYVQIDGMGPREDGVEAADDDAHSFRNKPAWQRFLVIFAGPAANWLLCAALLFGVGMTAGVSRYDTSRAALGDLEPQGPAAQAGLQAGDVVEEIGQKPVADWQTLVQAVRSHPGEEVSFQVRRGSEELHIAVTPKATQGGQVGVIEAAPMRSVEKVGVWGAVNAGISGAWSLTLEQGRLLLGLFTGHATGHLSGLPGMVKAVSQQAEHGLSRLIEHLAYISIGLCLLNLLPVPALDGGRMVFLGIEMVRRRPINERVEGWVHTAGFVLLLGMMVFVSVRDLL